jgi:hypothetical protein
VALERLQDKLTSILAAVIGGFAGPVRTVGEALLETAGEHRKAIDVMTGRHGLAPWLRR